MLKLLEIKPKFEVFSGEDRPSLILANNKNLKLSLEDKKINDNVRLLQLRVRNTGKDKVSINSLIVSEFEVPNVTLDKILENGWGQSSFSGYVDATKPTRKKVIFLKRDQNPFSFRKNFGYLEKSIVNEWYTQLVSKGQAIVIGAVTTKDYFSQIYVRNNDNSFTIRIACQVDGLSLDPGKEISSEKIVIVAGGIEESLEEFGNLIKQFNQIKPITAPPKGLCCAYYHQGNRVDEKYILEQLAVLDRLPGKLGIEYVQIDAGYSPWGDWLDTEQQFPSGMEFIVKDIKKRGIKAGIWIAPFVASPTSKLFREHNDWFLKDDHGRDFEARFTSPFDFLPFLSLRALDVTHPGAQDHLTKVIGQFIKWGFEFIKTDFTYPVCFSTNYHKRMTRAQVLRLGFDVIRKAAGNKVHLMSRITQISPLVGVIDSVKVGLDTLNPFVFGIPVIRGLVNNWMLRQDLRNCEARQFLNGKVWINDADCLVCKTNSGLSREILNKHYSFLQNYKGSKWIGDHLGELEWDKYEKYVLDLFNFKPGQKPAISVVVPAWNEERTIQKTLYSLARQETKVPFGVIFVDNNCTDNTVNIVKSFIDKLSRLKIICEKKQGIGAARESGFRNAEAEIIASTDADTIVPNDWISRIFGEFWKRNDLVGVVGTYIFESKSNFFNAFSKVVMMFADYCHRLLTGSFAFRGLNFAVKKCAWKKAGGFNRGISALEDVELSLRVGKLGKIKYLPNLTLITTYRRFEGRFFKQLRQRAKAYIYRVLIRSSNKYRDWEARR